MPPQCDPSSPSFPPSVGLAGPGGGCLLQGNGGLALSPKTVHTGGELKATLPTPPQNNERSTFTWDWSGFANSLGQKDGIGTAVSGCGAQATSCTVRVQISQPGVYTYTHGVAGAIVPCCSGTSVSSDFFGVDVYKVSGTVKIAGGPTKVPNVGVNVEARGPGGTSTAPTDSTGTYSLLLDPGSYTVSVVKHRADPKSRRVRLNHDVSGVDFVTGCTATPTFELKRVRVGRDTSFAFVGRNWDTADCGPVSVAATTVGGTQPLKVFDSSDFTGQINVKGRACGLKLVAQQASGREREVTDNLGHNVHAVVVLADPGMTPSGEQLFPGDLLCESDAAGHDFGSGHYAASDVSAVAQRLGQRLLEIQGGDNSILADASGKVAVIGISGQDVAPAELKHLTDAFPGSAIGSSAGDVNVTGFQASGGSLTIGGNLTLSNGVLVVHGDLTVGGAIVSAPDEGGAVFATGNITAASANLVTDDQWGLVASGKLNLP